MRVLPGKLSELLSGRGRCCKNENRRTLQGIACFWENVTSYFFLKVEHSVSAQHVQSERMPFWLVTLIVSAVHSSSAKWTHSETLHFTFVLLI